MEKLGKLSAVVAAILVALATPALAQEPPKSPAAKAEAKALEVELRQEAIERALDSVAKRLAKSDAAKADLVKAHRAVSKAFAIEHADADIETTLDDFFSKELDKGTLEKTDLRVELDVFRGWRDGYRLKSVSPKLVPEDATAFSPKRTTGYPPEVAKLDNSADHSMHDLPDYLADRFTRSALDHMVTSGRTVEIHVGSESEALADLRNRGFNVFGEVRAPNGTYERLFLAESPEGEVRYVITGDVNGADRVSHLASILRFAGENRTGVPAKNVEVVGDVDQTKARNLADVKLSLEKLATPGETAIVGFRMALRNEIADRAVGESSAERVREVLGKKPLAGLERKLEKERDDAKGADKKKLDAALEKIAASKKLAGLELEPAQVFATAKDLAAFRDAEEALVEIAKGVPSKTLGDLISGDSFRVAGGKPANDVVATRSLDAGELAADELTVKTADGERSVLLVNNYYGDALGTVVKGLLETGRRKIAYFGTAGGTAEDARIGDIHVPRAVVGHDSVSGAGVENAFVRYFEEATHALGERLKLGTLIGNVFSPIVETMEWLAGMRTQKVDAVEVETGSIASEIEEHNKTAKRGDKAELLSSVILSDVPGSENTLGANNSLTSSTFEKMVDHYLAALGIEGVVLRDPRARSSRPLGLDERETRALEVAEKLVPRELAKSSFLRDRLAEILAGVDAKTLEKVDTSAKLTPAKIAGLPESVRTALEREIAGAYTDKALMESLEHGNSVVSRLAGELRSKFPKEKFDLRVGGGIERGAYSPVDGLTVEIAGSAKVQDAAAKALARLLAETPGANVKLGAAGAGGLSLGRGDAFADEPEPLVRMFGERALEDRGVLLRGNSPDYVAPATHETAGEGLPTPDKARTTTSTSTTARPTPEELAKLTVPELMQRAMRETGRTDLPADRAALVSLLSGVDAKTVTQKLRTADASRSAATGRGSRDADETGITDRLKDLMDSRTRGESDRGER